MNTKLTSKIIVFLLIFAFAGGIFQVAYSAYSEAVKNGTDGTDKPAASDTDTEPVEEKIEPPKAISIDDMGEPVKHKKSEIDVSSITISKEIEDSIKSKEKKNSDKHINNVKKLVAKLNVPEQCIDEIKRLLKEGYSISDILITYEFLYDNYGQISDFEKLLSDKKAGKDFSKIFEEYELSNKEFVPSNFEPGYLENLLKSPDITADDVMIADRISQKGLKTFEELITIRNQGKSWMELKSDLGIVNTEEKLPRIGITSAQVKKYMEDSNLTEKEVVEALVIAGKLGKDDALTVGKAKSGKNRAKIMAELLEEEYK